MSEIKDKILDLLKDQTINKEFNKCETCLEASTFLKQHGIDVDPEVLATLANEGIAISLADDELDTAAGGMSDDEIIHKINTAYIALPEEIRDKIIESLQTYGRKASKAIAVKLTRNYEWAKDIEKLFD